MSLYDKIPELLERFDFDKVHRAMTFLNWTWRGEGVPTIDDLKSTASMCLYEAADSWDKRGQPLTGASCATGGFEATVNVYDNGGVTIQLLFYVDCVHSI